MDALILKRPSSSVSTALNPPLTPLAKQLFFQVIILDFTHGCCCINKRFQKILPSFVFIFFDLVLYLGN